MKSYLICLALALD